MPVENSPHFQDAQPVEFRSPGESCGKRPSMFGLIASDLRAKSLFRYDRVDWKGIVKVLLADGTAAMLLYRMMQWSRKYRLVPLEMLLNRLNSICCACIIGRGAEFGPAFVLLHSQGVVINGQVRGGANISIEHQVTIGAERNESPVLGSQIYIGAGAKIIGPVTLGDGARVGANAVVVHDVPEGATVVGIPARVVRQRSIDDGAGDEPIQPSSRRSPSVGRRVTTITSPLSEEQ